MKRPSKRRPPTEVPDQTIDSGQPHVRIQPHPLFAPPPTIVETVFFSKVGHTFGPVPMPFGPPAFVVQDFLLDQTGASGADGRMANTRTFDLTAATLYRFNVFPKNRAKRITVKSPGPTVFMGFNVGRRFVNAAGDVCDAYPATSFLQNLTGNPSFSYNYFFIGRNTNHWVQFHVDAEITSPISFSGFTTIGVYPPRSFDPGNKVYVPFSTGLPFNLPGPNSVPYLVFSYVTQSPVDPGPFVYLA